MDLALIDFDSTRLVQGTSGTVIWASSCYFVVFAVVYFGGIQAYRTIPRLFLAPILLFMSAGLALASVIAANRMFDHAVAETYHATIIEKHIARDRNNQVIPTIGLSPWHPQPEEIPMPATDKSVSSSDYLRYQVGDNVCVTLHRGLLGIGWWTLDPACR